MAGTSNSMRTRGNTVQRLWDRRLVHYPSTRPRIAYLGIVVLATIVVYYELYVIGAVAPSIIQQYGMSFRYFVDISVFSAAAKYASIKSPTVESLRACAAALEALRALAGSAPPATAPRAIAAAARASASPTSG